MMTIKETVLIIGGGYAGIHAAEVLNQAVQKGAASLRIILADAHGRHFKKVRLVQTPVRSMELSVPLSAFGWKHVELLQARLESVDADRRTAAFTTADGSETVLPYDRLVLALGSVPKPPAPEAGGFTLEEAPAIRSRLERQIRLAEEACLPEERASLLQAVVVGGGISGMETAAELAAVLNRERIRLGAAGRGACVSLVHAGDRLLPEAPERISRRLRRKLRSLGVETRLRSKAVRYDGARGTLLLNEGERIPASLCIWTPGVEPQPLLRRLGLPLHEDARLLTDPWYRVRGYDTIYAIGDNARIEDPSTGKPDGMTCKEAAPQAKRLAAILQADIFGRTAPPHSAVPATFCIGLGEGEGFVWMQKWGLDLVLTGKLGWRVREWTWSMASLWR